MKYNVLVVDVPWTYKNKRTGGSYTSGASQKYDVMDFISVSSLYSPLMKVLENDCVIFLWVTNPMIEQGLKLLKLWGFEYKTMVTWVKSSHFGMGYWFRGNTEHILVGKHGKMPPLRCQKINVFTASTNGHSTKPQAAYDLIEEATKNIPNRKVLELFARKQYKNWTCLGNTITGNDIRKDLKNLNCVTNN